MIMKNVDQKKPYIHLQTYLHEATICLAPLSASTTPKMNQHFLTLAISPSLKELRRILLIL